MRLTQSDITPATVPLAIQAGDVRARWAWTEPSVWTDRMLTALEQGVKGGVWYSLIRRGRGRDHQRWPNAFFAEQGLFNLTTAHALARQSVSR